MRKFKPYALGILASTLCMTNTLASSLPIASFTVTQSPVTVTPIATSERSSDVVLRMSKGKVYVVIDASGHATVHSKDANLTTTSTDTTLDSYKDIITGVTVKGDVEYVPEAMFQGFPNLKTLLIEDGVRYIETYAFAGTPLKEVEFPESIYTIQSKAFWDMPCLEKVTSYRKEKLVLGLNAFSSRLEKKYAYGYDVDTNYHDKIVEYGFIWGGTPEESSTVVMKVGTSLNYNYLTIDDEGNATLYKDTYAEALGLKVNTEETDTVNYRNVIKNIVIHESVTAIPDALFNSCKYATSLTMSNGIKTIGSRAFQGVAISKLVLPETVTTIGQKAFYNMPKLALVTNHSQIVQSIGTDAFTSKLTEKYAEGYEINVNYKDRVTNADFIWKALDKEKVPSIKDYTTKYNSDRNTVTVTLLGDNLDCGLYTLTDGTQLKSYEFEMTKNGIYSGTYTTLSGTKVGAFSFTVKGIVSQSTDIEESDIVLLIDGELTSRSNYVVLKDTGVAHVYSLNYGKEHAFKVTSDETSTANYTKVIKSAIIHDDVQYIAPKLFKDCKQLTSVVIPEGVVKICESAFRETGLRTLELPSTVTSIGEKAFYNLPYLEEVRNHAKVAQSYTTYPTAPLTSSVSVKYAYGYDINATYKKSVISEGFIWGGDPTATIPDLTPEPEPTPEPKPEVPVVTKPNVTSYSKQYNSDATVVTVTMTGTNIDKGTYSISDGAPQSSPTFTITKNGNYDVHVWDSTSQKVQSVNVVIDGIKAVTSAPDVVKTPTITSINKVYNSATNTVSVTLVGENHETAKFVQGSNAPQSSNAFVISSNGAYTFSVINSLGISVGSKTVLVTEIKPVTPPSTDRTPPEVTGVTLNTVSSGKNEITIFAKDNSSSTSSLEFSFDGKTYYNTNKFLVTNNKTYTIYCRDTAGNVTRVVYSYAKN